MDERIGCSENDEIEEKEKSYILTDRPHDTTREKAAPLSYHPSQLP
jgi:hypothetical protein